MGGMIMLFAPCCITFMLPAYLGTVFKAKRLVIWMTLMFALGITTIMLPLVLGARFLATFFNQYHFYVFALGSLLMIAIGVMSLLGKTIKLPLMARWHAPRVTNTASAYVLGVVSGISSTCCAPVLLGAVSLSVLSASWLQSVGVGIAYTLGIVFPLFIFGLFFEQGYWRWGQKLQQKTVSFGRATVPLVNFISFLLFAGSGIAFLILSATNRLGMNPQAAKVASDFRYYVTVVTKPIRALPYGDLLFGTLLLILVSLFIRKAIRQFVNEKLIERSH
ncbi:MAG: cytochrome c biogenesis protein CcdA [Patescibacteria group bacterium]